MYETKELHEDMQKLGNAVYSLRNKIELKEKQRCSRQFENKKEGRKEIYHAA